MSSLGPRSTPTASLFPVGFESAWLAPTKYLYFEQVPNAGRKTSIWKVVSRSSGVSLGRIAWYGPWRQYCFYPAAETIFNPDCLDAINEAIATCARWQRNIRENLKARSAA